MRSITKGLVGVFFVLLICLGSLFWWQQLKLIKTTTPSSNQETQKSSSSTSSPQSSSTITSSSQQMTEVIDANSILPAEVIGTWSGSQDKYDLPLEKTYIINQDGSGQATWSYNGQSGTDNFKINQIEEVGDHLYRIVDGDNINLFHDDDIGGAFVSYQYGFSIVDGVLHVVYWQQTYDTNGSGNVTIPYDYNKPSYIIDYYKVS